MDKITGKCLEAFIIFLVAHYREYRPDYAKFTDIQIIYKFKRRHFIDQISIMSLFIAKENNDGNFELEEELKDMNEQLVDFNKKFNQQETLKKLIKDE